MGSTADDTSSGQGNAAAGSVGCDGVMFTVTEGNEVAEVLVGGAVLVLGSDSFLDAATGTRHHFVDVQGQKEAMLFFVSVNEDQHRIVGVQRLF